MDHSFVVDVFVAEVEAVDRKFVAAGKEVAGGTDFAAYISFSSIIQDLDSTVACIVVVLVFIEDHNEFHSVHVEVLLLPITITLQILAEVWVVVLGAAAVIAVGVLD